MRGAVTHGRLWKILIVRSRFAHAASHEDSTQPEPAPPTHPWALLSAEPLSEGADILDLDAGRAGVGGQCPGFGDWRQECPERLRPKPDTRLGASFARRPMR